MVNSIQITNDMVRDKILLPSNVKPARMAIATNILVTTTNENYQKQLLLHNLDPIKLNQWYPFFVSHNALYDFNAESYDFLLHEFDEAVIHNGFDVDKRFVDGRSAILEILKKKDISISNKKVLLDEFWIKYSVSQEIWTIYQFEYYSMNVNKGDLVDVLNDKQFALLPLSCSSADEWLKTGEYLGIKIVDNIINLLREPSIRTLITI